MISRHKYHKSIQSYLAFYRRNTQGHFQQRLNEQVQAESLFLEVSSLPSVFQEEAY